MGGVQPTGRSEQRNLNKLRNTLYNFRPLTKDPNILTITLLGSNGAGKSTISRFFRHQFAQSLTEKDLQSYKAAVYFNAFYAMDQMVEASNHFSSRDGKTHVRKDFFIRDDFVINDDRMLQMAAVVHEIVEAAFMGGSSPYGKMDHKNVFMLKKLWEKEPVIQRTFLRGNEYGLVDSCRYMMQNLDRLANQEYIPTITDVLNLCISSGTTTRIPVNLSQLFSGGWKKVNAKLEEKKNMQVILQAPSGKATTHSEWLNEFTDQALNSGIHYTPSIDIALYIISLSEYDHLGPSQKENMIVNSLRQFEETVNAQDIIGEAEFYLIFNKRDLFLDKIMWKDLFTCVPMFSPLKQNDLMLHRPIQPPSVTAKAIDEKLLLNRDRQFLEMLIEKHCCVITPSQPKANDISLLQQLSGTVAYQIDTSDFDMGDNLHPKLNEWKSRGEVRKSLRPVVPTELIVIRSITEVSNDDLMHIFSYLFVQDICAVNRVCYKWYLLSGSDFIWSRLCLMYQPTLSEEFVQQVFAENVFAVYNNRLREIRTLRRNHKVSERVAFFNELDENGKKNNVSKGKSIISSQHTVKKENRPILNELQTMSAHMYKSYFITMKRLFLSNMRFIVEQYLSKVQDPERRAMLRDRVFITSALNTNEMTKIFHNVIEDYINNHS